MSAAGATDSVVSKARGEEFARRLAEAAEAYATVNDYVCAFVIQERLGGDLGPRRVGALKFKRPFAVYIKWYEGPDAGTQVLFVRGQNDGKMLARGSGLASFATLHLDTLSKLAMRGSRHPITEAGIGHVIEIIAENYKRGVTEKQVGVRRLPDRPSIQPPGTRYELLFTAGKDAGYYCKRAVITFDPKTHLPVAIQAYDWKNQLVEDYRYRNLRVNVGLTSTDFDPKNPEYGF